MTLLAFIIARERGAWRKPIITCRKSSMIERRRRRGQSRRHARQSSGRAARRFDLFGRHRLQAEPSRFALQPRRGGGLFARQQQASPLLRQLVALAAQALALVTVMNRGEALSGREDKTARQQQPRKKQQGHPPERAFIMRSMNGVVRFVQRQSFHLDFNIGCAHRSPATAGVSCSFTKTMVFINRHARIKTCGRRATWRCVLADSNPSLPVPGRLGGASKSLRRAAPRTNKPARAADIRKFPQGDATAA